MPYNFVTSQAGSMLSSLDSIDQLMEPSTVLKLILVASVALIPPLLKKTGAFDKLKKTQ
jgi:hypothetical protein